MPLEYGQEIHFQNSFVYERELGKGGTGQTILVRDPSTNIYFAIKKFDPIDEPRREELYKRFTDEIAILTEIHNPNIVRLYTYYLYPQFLGGYIQMEYIKGSSIDVYCSAGRGSLEDLFIQAISGFLALEQHNVLHRDVRPQNILVSESGALKIIDFGFGKQLSSGETAADSVYLNWPVTDLPEEIASGGAYGFHSEVYFVGMMYAHLLRTTSRPFKYQDILERMIQQDMTKRFRSFGEVSLALSDTAPIEPEFYEEERDAYQNFAGAISMHVVALQRQLERADVATILSRLQRVLTESTLEYFVQSTESVLSAVLTIGYSYRPNPLIEVGVVRTFYYLLRSRDDKDQRVILDNLYARLSTIKVRDKVEDDDEPVPF